MDGPTSIITQVHRDAQAGGTSIDISGELIYQVV